MAGRSGNHGGSGWGAGAAEFFVLLEEAGSGDSDTRSLSSRSPCDSRFPSPPLRPEPTRDEPWCLLAAGQPEAVRGRSGRASPDTPSATEPGRRAVWNRGPVPIFVPSVIAGGSFSLVQSFLSIRITWAHLFWEKTCSFGRRHLPRFIYLLRSQQNRMEQNTFCFGETSTRAQL